MGMGAQGDNRPDRPADGGAPSLMNWIMLTFAMAIVIVAILTLLGPAIGNTFSSIVVGI